MSWVSSYDRNRGRGHSTARARADADAAARAAVARNRAARQNENQSESWVVILPRRGSEGHARIARRGRVALAHPAARIMSGSPGSDGSVTFGLVTKAAAAALIAGVGAAAGRWRHHGEASKTADPRSGSSAVSNPAGEPLSTVTIAEKKHRGRENDPAFELDSVQAAALLAEVRKRAEGWRIGSASLVAIIVVSLALRSDKGWMTSFKGVQLYFISGLVILALLLALLSTWFILRAANGPYRLDTRTRDYRVPHDAKRFYGRAKAAAKDLARGHMLLCGSVILFSLAAFASWLLDPGAGSSWTFR